MSSYLKGEELDPDNTNRRADPAVGMCVCVCVCVCVVAMVTIMWLSGDEEAVSVRGGSFTWDTPERPVLSKLVKTIIVIRWLSVNYNNYSIDLSVKRGELVAVVGPVGAGKSSLISALLGEMDKLNGQVLMRVSVSLLLILL